MNERLLLKTWCLLMGLSASTSTATGYNYTEFRVPGAGDTIINGVNNAGWLAGIHGADISVVQPIQPGWQAFYYSGQSIVTLAPPDAVGAEAADVNDAGIVVGNFIDNTDTLHGYVFDGTSYSIIDAQLPDVVDTTISNIDNHGVLVGAYSEDFTGGLLLTANFGFRATPAPGGGYTFEKVDLGDPTATFSNTFLSGRNDFGMEVATVRDVGIDGTGFVRDDRHGVLLPDIQVRYPGATATELSNINNSGIISGRATFIQQVSSGDFEITEIGFTVKASDLTTLSAEQVPFTDLVLPGTGCTSSNSGVLGNVDPNCHRGLQSINDQGVVVGFYDLDDGVYRGFIGTPSVLLDGDFDSDGDVDGSDLLKWQRDGSVPPQFAQWQANFGSAGSAQSLPLPEPVGWAIAVWCSCLLIGGRHST
jgi:hypothetical protein